MSYSSNKGEDPSDTSTDEHSRANMLRVGSDCLFVVAASYPCSESVTVLRIDRVFFSLRQCVEPPVRFNFRREG